MLGLGGWMHLEPHDTKAFPPPAELARWAWGLSLGHLLLAPLPGGPMRDVIAWVEENEAAVHFTAAHVRLFVGLPVSPHFIPEVEERTRAAFAAGVDGVVAMLSPEWNEDPSGDLGTALSDALLRGRPEWAPASHTTLGVYAPRVDMSIVPVLARAASALDVAFLDGEWTRWPDGNAGVAGIAHQATVSALMRASSGVANVTYVGPARGYPWPGLSLDRAVVDAWLEMGLDGQAIAWMNEADECVLEALRARAGRIRESQRPAARDDLEARRLHKGLLESVPPSEPGYREGLVEKP